LGRTEIEAYLSETATLPGISNRDVQQARHALELYYEQFRGIPLAPRPDSAPATVSYPRNPVSGEPMAPALPCPLPTRNKYAGIPVSDKPKPLPTVAEDPRSGQFLSFKFQVAPGGEDAGLV
jgi:hypothetical protein